MRYPNFLKDLEISYVAPSFGCTTSPYKERLLYTIEKLKQRGYKINIGPNVYNDIGYRSNKKELCAKEIMDYYKLGNLMWSVGGGIMEGEIIDEIDFNLLKKENPCWFLGYSDNTYLTFLFTTLLDVASIYTICASELGCENLYQSQLDLLDLIEGKKLTFKGYPLYEKNPIKSKDFPLAPYHLDTKKEIISTKKDLHMEGRLIGGCLDCLHELIGTKYDKVKEFNEKYKNDKIIWFIESCDLLSYDVRLKLLHMIRAGWFENLAGFLIGRPLKNDSIGDLTMEKAFIETLKIYNVPILYNVDIGHIKPTIPIISGAYAKIDYEDEIQIEYILK